MDLLSEPGRRYSRSQDLSKQNDIEIIVWNRRPILRRFFGGCYGLSRYHTGGCHAKIAAGKRFHGRLSPPSVTDSARQDIFLQRPGAISSNGHTGINIQREIEHSSFTNYHSVHVVGAKHHDRREEESWVRQGDSLSLRSVEMTVATKSVTTERNMQLTATARERLCFHLQPK